MCKNEHRASRLEWWGFWDGVLWELARNVGGDNRLLGAASCQAGQKRALAAVFRKPVLCFE
jgi:hypothetical protein